MSKNGKLLFRDFDPYITSYFGYRIHPITKVRTLHAGVDYGTNEKKIPAYAIENGIVSRTGFYETLGNYVYVKYPRLGKTGLYQHLDKISVKNNQIVTKDTIIGYVGNTGEVTGIHLHFGWFNSNEQDLDWYSKTWEDFEKYEYIPELSIIGNPIKRDENVDQIEIKITNLRVRKSPNGEILGYIKPGFYNILDSKVENNYTWYLIGDNMWVAYSLEFANLYLKKEVIEDIVVEEPEEIIPEDDNDEEIPEEPVKKNFLIRFFNSFVEFIKKILKKLNVL